MMMFMLAPVCERCSRLAASGIAAAWLILLLTGLPAYAQETWSCDYSSPPQITGTFRVEGDTLRDIWSRRGFEMYASTSRRALFVAVALIAVAPSKLVAKDLGLLTRLLIPGYMHYPKCVPL
jgi:hypothetical protein